METPLAMETPHEVVNPSLSRGLNAPIKGDSTKLQAHPAIHVEPTEQHCKVDHVPLQRGRIAGDRCGVLTFVA